MQFVGLFSIALCWAGLLFLIRRWKGNVSMTFSQHAAQYKSAQVYHFALFTIVLPLFYCFMLGWFTPTFKFGLLFKVLITFSAAALYIAAVVPETKGIKVIIHRQAAFAMAYTLLPVVILIYLNTHVSATARIVALLCAVYMLGEIVVLKNNRRHPKMLIVQASYVAAFHTAILAATFSW